MSFKLTILSVLVVLSTTWVSNAKTPFPAPAPPSGPHSQCGIWRSTFAPDQGIQSSSANLLTSKQTQALKSLTKRSSLRRRIDPSEPTQMIADATGAPGACGSPYASDDNVVCLWNGAGFAQPASGNPTPGWVTGSSPNNCYRSIWVQANGKMSRGVLAESCAIFGSDETVDLPTGCSAIFISGNMFAELGYTSDVGSITIDSWDFDSPHQNAW
ncbi:uncharacterized protein MELLADRAFT_67654 [Melampsora larici-populina 98AG31]|uniref:Secreted protein n=1 Tax=Melampsora larici-populina (strain 98AG31 / pathotype 3-4-7) TaxID=747676 RepID=F4S3Y8_MELLP|nr:uncharacterized protein MELLADRAFT_67654 [Melampsora larici-populina 98AG31]EGG00614.1 secreted protein [Melampsora larici-populina 98AG31]